MKVLLRKSLPLIIAGVIGGLIGASIITFTIKSHFYTSKSSPPSHLANYTIRNITQPTFDFTEIAEIATPTVVHITTNTNESPKEEENQMQPQNPFDFFQFFNHPNMNVPRQVSGSGVIISADGYIVTNNHVIDGAEKIEVTLNDKRTYTAKMIGTDNQTDIAVIKINEKDLSPLNFGNSDNLKVGEWVVAVGNPFNLNSTITAGIVSAKGRNLNLLQKEYAIESFIQTDAVVNPGNSGGALVNVQGELIGINTAIATQTGTYEGYSFAVPSNLVKKVVEDILKYGNVKRGYLGAKINEVTEEIAKEHNLDKICGVHVAEVMDNSAAKDAGIKKDDIITKIEGKKVNSVPELLEQVSRHRPGDKIKVTALRNSKEMEFEVTLKDKSGNTEIVETIKGNSEESLGADFDILSKPELSKLGLQSGLRVKNLRGGKLKSSGVPNGFIVTKIDKKKVTKPEDITQILNSTKGGVLLEGLNPDGSKGYYGIGTD